MSSSKQVLHPEKMLMLTLYLNSASARRKTLTRVKVKLATPEETIAASFAQIIKTDGLVSIGPLEYRGNGIPVVYSGKT